MKKTYLVVGLGRFGSAVAQRLYELGSEVMAVDQICFFHCIILISISRS